MQLADGEFGPEFNSLAEAGKWAREHLMADADRSGSWVIVYLREGNVVGSCSQISFRR